MLMGERMAWLLIFVGAMLIATGCAYPLKTATITANTAAVALVETRADVMAHRKAAQRAAAKRVKGERSDPTVKAEQHDRARTVGLRYRRVWEAYETARKEWVSSVAIIKIARDTKAAGGEPNLMIVAKTLEALALAQRRLYMLAHEFTGMLGDGPPKGAP